MFISVGPPAFTGLAFIGMANAALKVFPQTFVVGATDVSTAQVLKIVAVFVAIVLWTLSLFFFCISLLATLCGLNKMSFHLVSTVRKKPWSQSNRGCRRGGHLYFRTPDS